MKKVLILSSTPRKGGNSDLLCDRFLQGAQEAGHSVEKIFLKSKQINYCTGCGACFKKKACTQKDDAAEILEKMVQADVLVLATPVYFYTMSAQMKTLIDRTCPRYEELNDKEFYFLMTAADEGKEAMDGTVDSFRRFLYCLDNPIEKGFVYGTGAWQLGDIKASPAMQEAYEMGKAV